MILELKDICKTYYQGKMEVPVLKDVSLSVAEGEYLAIMGPSGSGKTTLMNLIGCLDVPTSGQYFLEGQELSGESDAKLSLVRLHSIGFVFQSFYLLSRQSAVDNVALPLLYAGVRRRERTEKAKIALERVGLGDRTNFKPSQLSGGQCQRVAIARAIVNNPKILLADEPTGALDTKSGEQIMEIFQKLNDEGVTIVMITHDPDIAAHAKRTVYIRDGELLLTAPAPSAVKKPQPTVSSVPAAAPIPALFGAPVTSAEQAAVPAVTPVEITDPFARQEEPALIEIEEIIPFGMDEEESENTSAPGAIAQLEPEPEPEEKSAASAPEEETFTASEAESEQSVEQEIESELLAESTAAFAEAETETPAAEEMEEPTAEKAEEPVEEALPEAAADGPDEPVEEASLEAPMEEAAEELPNPDAQLEAEISALLDHSEEDSFAAGDAFLKEAGIEPDQPEEPEEEQAEAPVLVTKATKEGAPDQISFDIWAEPEPIDVEAIEVDLGTEEDEPLPEEVSFEAPAADSAPDQADEEPYSGEGVPPKMVELDLFDAAAKPLEAAPLQEEAGQGQFGSPRKTEVDLSSAFTKETHAAFPWGAPAEGADARERLIEIEDLGLSSSGEEDEA